MRVLDYLQEAFARPPGQQAIAADKHKNNVEQLPQKALRYRGSDGVLLSGAHERCIGTVAVPSFESAAIYMDPEPLMPRLPRGPWHLVPPLLAKLVHDAFNIRTRKHCKHSTSSYTIRSTFKRANILNIQQARSRYVQHSNAQTF